MTDINKVTEVVDETIRGRIGISDKDFATGQGRSKEIIRAFKG